MTGRTELLGRDSRDLRVTAGRSVTLAEWGADRWDDCLQRAFIPTKDDAPAGYRVSHGRLVGRSMQSLGTSGSFGGVRASGRILMMAASPLRLPTRQLAP